MKNITPHGAKTNWVMFLLGVVLFIGGIFLIADLIVKFLRFTVGIIIIFISFYLMFGSGPRVHFRRFGMR